MVLLTVRRRAAKMIEEMGSGLENLKTMEAFFKASIASKFSKPDPIRPDPNYLLSLDQAEKQYGHLMTNCLLKALQHEKEGKILHALATFSCGFASVIPENNSIETPIVVPCSEIHSSPVLLFVFAGKRSKASFELVATGAHALQLVTFIFAEEEAHINFHITHQGGNEAFYATRATIKQKAQVTSTLYADGGKGVAEYVKMHLMQEQAMGTSHSLYIAREQDSIESVKEVIHATKCTTSEMSTKAVVGKGATVHSKQETLLTKEADESTAKQHARALLLHKSARFQAIPKLDIMASNVQASHGVSVGALDEEALLYARARGLSEEEARKLLIEAFIREALIHHSNQHGEEFV